jgi:hypothetical protein
VALEVGEDPIASFGVQPREGVCEDLLVFHDRPGSGLGHQTIIREP